MSKNFKRVRKKYDAETEEIVGSYDREIEKLEAEIDKRKRERDTKLVTAEKQYHKDFGIFIKSVVGEEDYNWLSEWLIKKREEEMAEEKRSKRTKRLNELREMSLEDYLFCYFSGREIKERLKKVNEKSKSEETARLSFILAKLKLENLRLDRTLM